MSELFTFPTEKIMHATEVKHATEKAPKRQPLSSFCCFYGYFNVHLLALLSVWLAANRFLTVGSYYIVVSYSIVVSFPCLQFFIDISIKTIKL